MTEDGDESPQEGTDDRRASRVQRTCEWAARERKKALGNVKERYTHWKDYVSETHGRQWAACLGIASLAEVLVVCILLWADNGWVQWGNVPTWVGANLTAAAVSLALATTIADRRKQAEERQVAEEERREQEKRQARLVFVETKSGKVVITNYSDRPVFRLSAKVMEQGYNPETQIQIIFERLTGGGGRKIPDLNVLKPNDVYVLEGAKLPSDDQIKAFHNKPLTERLVAGILPGMGLPKVEIRITDAEGNRWRCVHTITNADEPSIELVI
ncbi:hypothetical protein [Gordonia sp. (in: high G+C Gram-positive bacteria)]|uniref:hypothetical protein n=1 Tax=Gordonia sp. (in: high G+C Gram-positive bacteria) TaxID=84139 RepID=UPI003F9D9E2E